MKDTSKKVSGLYFILSVFLIVLMFIAGFDFFMMIILQSLLLVGINLFIKN